jgi:hypothetical protein
MNESIENLRVSYFMIGPPCFLPSVSFTSGVAGQSHVECFIYLVLECLKEKPHCVAAAADDVKPSTTSHPNVMCNLTFFNATFFHYTKDTRYLLNDTRVTFELCH